MSMPDRYTLKKDPDRCETGRGQNLVSVGVGPEETRRYHILCPPYQLPTTSSIRPICHKDGLSSLDAVYSVVCRGLPADASTQKNSYQDDIRTAGLHAYGLAPVSMEVPTDLHGLGVLLLQAPPISIRREYK